MNPSVFPVAADLCAVAEACAPDPSKLIYVIGAEVPIPGGETEEPDALDISSVERFRATINTHREAFSARGLDNAETRIVSVVIQPGIDFSHTSIFPLAPEKAQPLSAAILSESRLTFEAIYKKQKRPVGHEQADTDPGILPLSCLLAVTLAYFVDVTRVACKIAEHSYLIDFIAVFGQYQQFFYRT